MNSHVPAVPKVIYIEDTNYRYVNTLNPDTVEVELNELTEKGYFEKIDIDLPILRFRNLKPKDIPGKVKDNESFLLIIDNRGALKAYKIV